MENEKEISKLNNDIRIAALVAIVYGVCGVLGAVSWPFLPPALKGTLASIEFSPYDLAWNFLTSCFSIWWGTRIKQDSPKKLRCLSNLLGLYLLKMGIVVGALIVLGVFQAIRTAYLLPGIFLIFLGLRAQIKIQKLNGSGVQEKYKFRLSVWIMLAIVFIAFCAVTGFLDRLVSESLMNAILNENSQGVLSAVKNGENPNRKILGRPLLFMGIAEGDDFCVKALVEAGADINARSAWGRTALHEAALNGQVEIAEFLLRHGADVNARNKRGETPLFYATGGMLVGPAMTERHKEIARLLLDNGADPNSKNRLGNTPMNVEAGEALKKATQAARQMDFGKTKEALEEMKKRRSEI